MPNFPSFSSIPFSFCMEECAKVNIMVTRWFMTELKGIKRCKEELGRRCAFDYSDQSASKLVKHLVLISNVDQRIDMLPLEIKPRSECVHTAFPSALSHRLTAWSRGHSHIHKPGAVDWMFISKHSHISADNEARRSRRWGQTATVTK